MSPKQPISRRTLLTMGGVVATGGLTTLAGCAESSTEPPPRKSNVIDEIELSTEGSRLLIDPYGDSDRWVKSRRDLAVETSSESGDQTENTESIVTSSALASLSPVGTARAAKGRGATGRGSGGYNLAPPPAHGRGRVLGGVFADGGCGDDKHRGGPKPPPTPTPRGA